MVEFQNQQLKMFNLHLIEPTLFDQTGHGFSYNSSIIKANNDLFNIHVWLDKKGDKLFANTPCTSHPYFYRRLRRLQKMILYYKLLITDSIIYICTAELTDLVILTYLHKIVTVKAKVFLHFHQFNQKKNKLKTLQKIAQANYNFYIFTPTNKLTALFQIHGFKNCNTIHCPSYIRSNTSSNSIKKFEKVIYAGAARKDKGFPEIVELVCYLKKTEVNLPITIQISPPNSGRYDQESQLAIQKLEALPQDNITLLRATLDQAQYQALFVNSICLLIYDVNSYHDKFSGVLLDACYAGCPIITVANTWMGETVNRFNAGITVTNRNPETILNAINSIQQSYFLYSNNADHAATILSCEHDPKNTLLAIKYFYTLGSSY